MIRIATRRSALAQAQAHQVGEALTAATGEPVELVPLATTGDDHPDRAISAFDAKGLFVDGVRQAVLDDRCDIAVHSAKDLPTTAVAGLTLAAVPAREDPRDLLVSRTGYALASLPHTAIVGTSSERRRVQVLRAKPGLQIVPVRGNLDTRLRKVGDGEFDAIVIAFAGLRRLYTSREHGGVGPLGLPLTASPLEPGECLSAPGQGALAIEARADDERALEWCAAIDDRVAHAAVRAERAFLAAVDGGCLAPVGALATTLTPGTLELGAMIADPGRRQVLRGTRLGPLEGPEQLGRDLAAQLRESGGEQILAAIAARRDASA